MEALGQFSLSLIDHIDYTDREQVNMDSLAIIGRKATFCSVYACLTKEFYFSSIISELTANP